jgi:hypothetical protein
MNDTSFSPIADIPSGKSVATFGDASGAEG